MPQTNTYNPEIWLESTTRALKEYVDNAFSAAYEVIMEFPSTEYILKMVPLEKTVIHFEIDTVDPRLIGFGLVAGTFNYDSTNHQAQPQEAADVRINCDVGIWASARSGGTTSRMRAYETLSRLFQGKYAQDALTAAVSTGDGTIEILNFTGGRFLTDTINDVDVYRTVDSTLDLRVFSRRPVGTPEPTIESAIPQSELTIDGNVLLT